jgi:mannose-6-phosphate isomerase-like protein (cupin superfamily)
MKSSADQEVHLKGWGSEKWIVNNESYCGKILYFKSGKKCSWHYHKLKRETFFVQSGQLLVKFSYDDELEKADEVILFPGDSFEVPQGLRHQMLAIEETFLIEFSTQHFEEDSYRIEKGD